MYEAHFRWELVDQAMSKGPRSGTSIADRTDVLATEREQPELATELYRRCVKASRGLAFAEAIVLLVVGFTLDDLDMLAFPGYAAGAVGAILVLAGGRLIHGRNLARRIAAHGPDRVDEILDAARLRNTVAAILAILLGLGWLVVFTAGVPPWAL